MTRARAFFVFAICILFSCQKDLNLDPNDQSESFNRTAENIPNYLFDDDGVFNSKGMDGYAEAMRRRGGALSFDGIDDYVVIPDDPSLDITSGFTVAAWIYIAEYVEWASIVTKGGLPADASDSNNYTIHQSGIVGGGEPDFITEFGHLRFTGDGMSYSTPPLSLPESESVIPTGEWHFVCVSFDGSVMKFYLDGKNLDGTRAVSGPLNPNDDPLYIGVDFPGDDEFWKGMIDEVKIWNIALNKGQINAAMRGRATPAASHLSGYWSFDEGSGTTAHDRSRNGNDGTLIGGPTWVSF